MNTRNQTTTSTVTPRAPDQQQSGFRRLTTTAHLGRRASNDAFTLMATPIALMGLMLLTMGVVSAMGQLGF